MPRFKEIFSWWSGNTFGMRLTLWRRGEFVGKDEFGNKYYRDKKGHRRYVIYNGTSEASSIPPGWHGWMHYITDVPPVDEKYQPRSWQKTHQSNQTGTAHAYRPDGSTLASGQRPPATGDYEAWQPNNK